MIVDILLDSADEAFGKLQSLAVEHNDRDLHFMRQKEPLDFGKRNMKGFIFWEAVRARGNERESDALAREPVCQLKGVIIAGTECVPLPVVAIDPHRANGMNDVFGVQSECLGLDSLAGSNITDNFPRCHQLFFA